MAKATIDGTWASVVQTVMARAKGRCECTTECGHPHTWTPSMAPRRCRAPHGCSVQRKDKSPSYWILAGTEDQPIAYPKPYRRKVILIELAVIAVDGDDTNRAKENLLAVCQRCKLLIERRRGKS